jgi:tripartite-type tricarboxylate transporter receptor subunit TctC
MFKFLISVILVFGAVAASAFELRNEPITVIVGFAPGGGADVMIRPYLEKIEQLGYSTRVEYKAGANGTIALNHLSTLPRDGKTIMVASASSLVLSYVFERQLIKHDGFELVSAIGFGPMVLITSVNNKVNSFDDFVADMKHGKSTFAAGSLQGSAAALYITSKLGISKDSVVIANYKGMGPAALDVAGGHATYAVGTLAATSSLLDAGKIKLLAIGGNSRNPKFPQVPTFVEKIKGFAVETTESNWGIILPKNTPKEIVDFYANLFITAGKDKTLQEKLSSSSIYIHDADLGPTKYNQIYQRSLNAWQEIKN